MSWIPCDHQALSSALHETTGLLRELCDKIVDLACDMNRRDRLVRREAMMIRAGYPPKHDGTYNEYSTADLDDICLLKQAYKPEVLRYPLINYTYTRFNAPVYSGDSPSSPYVVQRSYELYNDSTDNFFQSIVKSFMTPTLLIGYPFPYLPSPTPTYI